MELEELKASWKAVNVRLDEMQMQQTNLQNAVGQGRIRSTARLLMREPILELLVGALTAIWMGGFLFDNLAKASHEPWGALPAVLIDACAIFTIWSSIRQLITISGFDYANPILETQRQLAGLRSLRVRSTQWMLLLGIPLWIIFPIVAGQALIGYELWRSVSLPWGLGNLLFGVVFSGTAVVLARRFRWPVFEKIEAVLAGTEIAKAREILDELGRF